MKIINRILDVIYPPVCGICGKLNTNSLCNKCKNKLQNQISYKIEDYSNSVSYFDEHIYLFKYTGEIRKLILDYKFNEKSYLYETFVNFLKNNEKISAKFYKYDIIVPVPISKKRFKERGYNQSSILARKIAKIFDLEYNENILQKIKNNKEQSSLDKEKRNINVKDVYKIKKTKDIVDKNILIVDDIFTTGNTVNECSRVLKELHTGKIGVFTIAKD